MTATRSMGWILRLVLIVICIGAIALAAITRASWLPKLQAIANRPKAEAGKDDHGAEDAHAGHDHAGHDHAGHDEGSSIKISEQARKNIGLRTEKISLKPFTRTVTLPALVVERPGRSTEQVTAPMTGVITKIYAVEGETVSPGAPLFDLRLTDEDLAQSQSDLLRTKEVLEILAQEIIRIEKVTMEGGLAGKAVLERKYEQQKEQVALRSQKQALLLHGFSSEQIENILQDRTLLQNITIRAPLHAAASEAGETEPIYQILDLPVVQGEHVTKGDSLVVLGDHATLFVEGEAFERDSQAIARVAEEGLEVDGLLENEKGDAERIQGLKILYVAPQVDPEKRTLHFYLTLENERVRDATLPDGRRIVIWRFRPGQRMQLLLPVETWKERIVLPTEAIAREGAESYAFTANGDHFDRRSVHVEYRDPQCVVIAQDGALFEGDVVAMSGAQQLQLALKNKAGGGIDPHAGHNH